MISERAVEGTRSATPRRSSAAFDPSMSPETAATIASGSDLRELDLGQAVTHQIEAIPSILTTHPDSRTGDTAVDLERVRQLLDQSEPAAARSAARRAPRAEVADLDQQARHPRASARTAKCASPGGYACAMAFAHASPQATWSSYASASRHADGAQPAPEPAAHADERGRVCRNDQVERERRRVEARDEEGDVVMREPVRQEPVEHHAAGLVGLVGKAEAEIREDRHADSRGPGQAARRFRPCRGRAPIPSASPARSRRSSGRARRPSGLPAGPSANAALPSGSTISGGG